MDFNKKQPAILFLDRNRVDFWTTGLSAPVSIQLPETVVNLLEVSNVAGLENIIKTFVQQNSLPPRTLTIILSFNILFEKDFVEILPEKREIEIQKFLGSIPFENLYSKSFSSPQATHVIAVNKDLCDAVKNSFLKLGFEIDVIVPYVALGPEANTDTLDLRTSQQIIKNLDSMKQYGIPFEKIDTSIQPIIPKETKTRKVNIRLYVMIGSLGILIMVLFTLLLRG